MSTKTIREALEFAAHQAEWRDNAEEMAMVSKALAEVEVIEKAARHMRALAPAEVAEAFKANPNNPKVLAWLGSYSLMCDIARKVRP